MNDTELRSRLQELADPPLAPRPSRAQLEDRIARRTRRRHFAAAAAAAAVLVAASAFVVSSWPWTQGAPGYVQVDDPSPAQSEASQPSPKDPSEMTDAELAAELDRILRSDEPIGDGASWFFGLGAELLGGQGDPRGVDTWWRQTHFETPAELATGIDEYVAEGLTPNEALDRPGYLEGDERTVALLREIADRIRHMSPPDRGPYHGSSVEGARVPVPEMAGHGTQSFHGIVHLEGTLVAAGQISDKEPGRRPVGRPAVVVSTDDGGTWDFIDLTDQGMADWDLRGIEVVDGRTVVFGNTESQDDANARPVAAISEDGRNWTPIRFSDGTRGSAYDVTITPDGLLVAVGTRTETSGPAVWTSTDARTWSAVDLPIPEGGARIVDVAAGPAGLVAVGHLERQDGQLLWWSTDGHEWESAAAPSIGITSQHLPEAWYVHDRYVIAGANGSGSTLWTSVEARDWARLDLDETDEFRSGFVADVTADREGRLIAVGWALDNRNEGWSPSPARWTENRDQHSMTPSISTEVRGRIVSVVDTPNGLLGVGDVIPDGVDQPDGVIWDIASRNDDP